MMKTLIIFILSGQLFAFNQHMFPKTLPAYPQKKSFDLKKKEMRDQISTCLFDYNADRDPRTLAECEELIQAALDKKVFTRAEVNAIFDQVTATFLK